MATMMTSDGVSIYYESLGAGPPLVFIPGYSGSTEIWMYQMLHLGRSFNCIIYDPRGHGRSDKPIDDYAWDTMARDLAELLDHLSVEDPVLVGWSMGGGIAATYALNHRMPSGMVLIAPTLPRFTQVMAPILRDPEGGAETAVWLASVDQDEAPGGRFYQDRRPRPKYRLPGTRDDDADRVGLYRICAEMAGLGAD